MQGASQSLNKVPLPPRATRQLARSDLDLKQAVTSLGALEVNVVAGSVRQNELKSIKRRIRGIQMRESLAQAKKAPAGANQRLRHLTIRAHGCNGDLHVLTPNGPSAAIRHMGRNDCKPRFRACGIGFAVQRVV